VTEFICGSAGTGKGSYIIERIKERLGSGRKMFLIVPEQQTVLWEARVCRALPPSAALELEVVNFKRLADTVFRSVGGLCREYTGEAKKILLMWSAVVSVRDELSVYGTGEGHEEKYVSLLLETLSELRTRGVTPAMLDAAREASDPVEQSELAKKLSDLSLIFSAYRKLEEDAESEDPDRILDMLAKVLREESFFKGCDVFIDSFYSLTLVESEILYYIMRDAGDVFITFTLDEAARGVHFDHVKKFFAGAKTYAARCSRDVVKVALEGNKRCSKKDILYLEKNLWDFSAKAIVGECDSVKIIRCRDRYEEACAVGAVIEQAVEGGAAYSDVAVIARDIETYRGILDTRLDALGIPYHLSKRWGVATSQVTSFITSLLEAVSDGCRAESVVKCLKTGLCPVTERECANFEEYAATWNIRGKAAYLKDEDFTMNPAGYKREMSDWGRVVLEDANKVRRIIKEPLSTLFSLFSGGTAAIRDVSTHIYDILISLGVYDRIISDAEELKGRGDAEAAEQLEKSFSAVVDALSAMASTLPEHEIAPDSFSRLFFAVASSFDTASIPSGVDVVTLGSASGVRCGEIKHAILIGCTEGEFPASPRDRGFFTDSDKEELESLGIILSDGKAAEQGEELFRFWRCVTMPSESLTVTYPTSGDEGSAAPSVGARQIMRLTGAAPADWADMAKTDGVWSVKSAADARFLPADSPVRRAIENLEGEFPTLEKTSHLSGALSADRDTVSAGLIKKMSSRRLNLTQARIDRFSQCPFSYYMKYVLKLDEPQRASVSAVDVGNLVHRVLELFFKETVGEEFPLPDGKTEEIVDRITADALSEIMGETGATPRQRYLFVRLRRSVLTLVKELSKEFSETAFRPYRFELSMGGEEGCPAPLVFTASDGTMISLYGTIDRVDTYSDGESVYVRVVDYKTFGKTFKMSDIQKGINLQLLIYLFTLWKGADCSFRRTLAPRGEEILPAGMIYLSSAPDSVSSDTPPTPEEALTLAASALGRSGLVLDDDVSLAAMGKAIGGKYLPGNRDALISLEEFGRLYDEIENVIISIGEDIRSGRCESRPTRLTSYHPCKFCKMRPVCRHLDERREDDE